MDANFQTNRLAEELHNTNITPSNTLSEQSSGQVNNELNTSNVQSTTTENEVKERTDMPVGDGLKVAEMAAKSDTTASAGDSAGTGMTSSNSGDHFFMPMSFFDEDEGDTFSLFGSGKKCLIYHYYFH